MDKSGFHILGQIVGRTEGAATVQMVMSGSHKVRDRSRGPLDHSGALP